MEESWRNALATLLLMPLAGTGQRERKLIDKVHMPSPDGEEVGSRKTWSPQANGRDRLGRHGTLRLMVGTVCFDCPLDLFWDMKHVILWESCIWGGKKLFLGFSLVVFSISVPILRTT